MGLKWTIFLSVVFVACISARVTESSQLNSYDLSEGWSFRKVGEEEYLPARVPGCIHTDLLSAGMIESPFYGCNEKDLQWIGENGWEYSKEFIVSSYKPEDWRYELVLEGLDTYADVFLNDTLVLKTGNMFREYRYDCTDLLSGGANTLRILFRPAAGVETGLSSAPGYGLPGGKRVFTRKAAFHYGWDWGPRFVTCGIWRPVRMEVSRGSLITGSRYSLIDLTPDRADYELEIGLRSHCRDPFDLCLRIETDSIPLRLTGLNGETIDDHEAVPSKSLRIDPSATRVRLCFSIHDPELWYPAGMGDQHLYDVGLIITDHPVSSDEPLRAYDVQMKKIGIRTIELVTDGEEKEKDGKPFFFRINGKPLFMKGANYIPRDSFHGSGNALDYEEIITSAVESNMNMLRVWGGGIYEDDIFYELCDRHGILVWQDFMFACAMYPWDEDFLENVREEAVQNVRRLADHPCIALWCGNNEIDEAWHNWGWQQSFDSLQRVEVWKGYEAIFHELLPEVVRQFGNGIPYHSSSPRFGRGDERSLTEGDCHYWGVWHDAEPFEVLLEKTGRFMSEFGFQSFPDLATVTSFAPGNHPNIDSPAISCHQKHPRGNSLIREYMARDYREPSDFEDFVYTSQLLQARGICMGIEAQRRAAPFCMGSLYWQLNDCWPVVSWSSIDYFGRRKALYYQAKKAFAPLLVSPVVNDGIFEVYLVDDRSITDGRSSIDGELIVETVHFSGLTHTVARSTDLVPSTLGPCFQAELDTLLPRRTRDSSLIRISLIEHRGTIHSRTMTERLFFPVPPRMMTLPDPGLTASIHEDKERYRIDLETERLAKGIFLSFGEIPGVFSDNYFDMAPGSVKSVFFTTGSIMTDPVSRLVVKTLYDIQ